MPDVKAITFDLWDTLVDDDSDEIQRKARGLRTKAQERRHVLWAALNARQPTSIEDVTLAYDVCDAAFNVVWKRHSITWTLDQRLDVTLTGLGRTLPDDVRTSVVDALGRMEVDIPPNVIPGVGEALGTLAQRYRLAIVSDAIVTPGWRLRELLEGYDLKRHFSVFAFSDEVGRSKPHPRVFEHVARELRIDVTQMVHVGDRDHNDIKGPQALGMRAVLFTATRDADKDTTSADAVCGAAADLPAAIQSLPGSRGH